MAFIRSNLEANPTSLIIADADGRNQHILITQQLPGPIFATVLNPDQVIVRPAWSPDGRVIAYPATKIGSGGRVAHMMFVSVSDGTVRLGPPNTGGPGVDWIDGSSLVLDLVGQSGTAQLWRLSYPGGNLSRVTNDLNTYRGVSVGADRNSLVTARTEVHGGLWIAKGDATEGIDVAQPIAASSGAIAWAGDRLVFSTIHPSLFVMAPPGGQSEELMKKASAPAITSDGKTLVYLSREAGSGGNLWKASADGRNPIQLVPGLNFWPEITPDDQDVIYVSNVGGNPQIWSVPLAGGKARLVSKLFAAHPTVSPDGKTLAFASLETGNQWFISVCELPGCSQPHHVRAMDVRGFGIRWTPDGRAIAYVPVVPGGNIWVHPLDGSPERQLTHFTDPRVLFEFAWSRDGKHLAAARASTSQDIVLFRGLKPKS
jgi:Tol biopolymer transport system component